MQAAPTFPLMIGDDRPQAERRELRLGEHRTPAVASVVPPKRSAQAEPKRERQPMLVVWHYCCRGEAPRRFC
jgi:hypothetical protein